MENAYKNCRLFAGLNEEQIHSVIQSSRSQIRSYQKNQLVFDQNDRPTYMYVLLRGSVMVGRDYVDGRESFMTTFAKPGDIFGEILLFLNKDHYDFFARADQDNTSVLTIPRSFLTDERGKDNELQHRLITNTMIIFANKAYFLQNRVQILSLGTLRQRLAKAILIAAEQSGTTEIKMPREEAAGYVNAARPSVSRELSAMEKDGLIRLNGSRIIIRDREKLEEISA